MFLCHATAAKPILDLQAEGGGEERGKREEGAEGGARKRGTRGRARAGERGVVGGGMRTNGVRCKGQGGTAGWGGGRALEEWDRNR